MSANASLNERTEPLRVAVYARVSTDKQDYGKQLIELREFCQRLQWEIVNEYCDTVSGSGKKDRVQFERMMLVRVKNNLMSSSFGRWIDSAAKASSKRWATSNSSEPGESVVEALRSHFSIPAMKWLTGSCCRSSPPWPSRNE